jgi:hypothetical protein
MTARTHAMAMRQLTIDEQRHEALIQRAKALRISEEELVRRAIDAVLAEPPVEPPPPDHERAAAEFLEAARVLAQSRGGAEPYRFCREELYEEREARWTRPQ